jgi:hypothetical protein
MEILTGRPGVSASGSNANGSYVQFADGTQICWFTDTVSPDATLALGSIFRSSAGRAWTFPSAFIAAPTCSAMCETSSRWATASATTTTSLTYGHLCGVSSASLTQVTHLTATGRWK